MSTPHQNQNKHQNNPINTPFSVLSELNYQDYYDLSVKSPEKFWAEMSEGLTWIQKPKNILSGDFSDIKNSLRNNNPPTFPIRWFEDGQLNASVNCLDRHLETLGDKTALIFEGDDPKNSQKISFKSLHQKVCKLANVLKSRNIKKGDTVCIYLPMIPEAVISMLACARIGAVHSVIFGGFSSHSIKERVLDSEAVCMITATGGFRGGKIIAFKNNVDEALKDCPKVTTNIVISHAPINSALLNWQEGRDVNYQEAMDHSSDQCSPEPMHAEDPLFILYTSGSTGKPKGVLHTTAGYLLYAALSHYFIFDIKPEDIYWCSADVGWITGHSYITYGPLANGTTTVLFEGMPNYPTHERLWEIIDRYKITIFYTSPTALRALMREGNQPLESTSRSSLRILGSVGEPINPECWQWFFKEVGKNRCPIMDTFFQTETGGFLLVPSKIISKQKPGCAQRPFFGIAPVLLDANQKPILGEGEGALCIQNPWPGIFKIVYKNPDKFFSTYFEPYPGYYFTGDSARRDQDGDIWIGGRMDDVINVSGHRLSTAEIESALVLHPAVAEAAVVGFPHPIKGEGIYAYISLMSELSEIALKNKNEEEILRKDLIQHVRKTIGPIVTIDLIQFAAQVPKTRSGKIMRRILRKIAAGDLENLGDTTTLANPDCIEALKKNREKI